eukprot:CAMPEP_0172807460 /NCGR_PEP_ID=MMETSP1075-20121228/7018_1 /TAXON_ID=2916 /ORGANISM="Ceratium fusus, Strain PA161109" /LENGTH=76 /DNA_ID=CAMNT_0013646447 /DNA_START=22 /DNA_END=252 /DNA_ORIENTATION=-
MTAEETVAMAAADAQEDREIALNVVLAVLCLVVPTTALMGVAVAVLRLVRNSRVFIAEDVQGMAQSYQKLLGSPTA